RPCTSGRSVRWRSRGRCAGRRRSPPTSAPSSTRCRASFASTRSRRASRLLAVRWRCLRARCGTPRSRVSHWTPWGRCTRIGSTGSWIYQEEGGMQAPVAPEFYVEEERPHLGGYIRGGDPATYYPQLWEWFLREQGVMSVLGVGCGEGPALADFHDTLGIRAQGIDGVDQDNMFIWDHDYTQAPFGA